MLMLMLSVERPVKSLARETELPGGNLPQCRVVHHKSHMTLPELQPGPPWWEAGFKPLLFSPFVCYVNVLHDVELHRNAASNCCHECLDRHVKETAPCYVMLRWTNAAHT
jgi:hypothetical protein